MTWQGSGGQGAPGEPDDDATRVDHPVPGSVPPPFTPPVDDSPTAPVPEAPSPFAPGGALADDEALRAASADPGEEPSGPPASPGDPTPALPPAAPPTAPLGTGLPPAPVPQAPSPWAAPSASGGWASVPPGAGALAVPGAPGLVYGGAVPRVVAYIIDAVLLGIVTAIITAPFAAGAVSEAFTNPSAFDPANPVPFGATVGIASILTLVIEAAYFTFLWSSSARATLGMRLLKLQIGDATTGNRIPVATAFRRWLAFGAWLNLLGFVPVLAAYAGLAVLGWQLVLLVTTATHPQRMGLHDRFANTAMVRPVNAGSGGYIIGCVLIAVAIVLFSFVALIFLGAQVSAILSTVGESV
jgi:uncharacterized RDD family membrane protein YckC